MSFVCWEGMNDIHLYISSRWCRAKILMAVGRCCVGLPSAGYDEPVDGNDDDDDDDDDVFKTVAPSLTSVGSAD